MPAPSGLIVGLDAGIAIVNNVLWGATRGGIRFNGGGIELRHIEHDGRRARWVGGDRVVTFDPQITMEVIEFSLAKVMRLYPGSTSANFGTYDAITPKKAGVLYATADYLTGFRVIWPLGENNKYFEIQFPKALVLPPEGPNGEDKSEVGMTVTIAAAQDLTTITIDDSPFTPIIRTGMGLV